MRPHQNTKLQRYDTVMEFHGVRIPYTYWAHLQGITPPDTIVFLGTAQINKIPLWVAQQCPPGTVVVQGFPHWLTKPDASDLGEAMLAHARHALRTIMQEFGVSTMHLVAESQAAPCAIWLASKLPQSVGSICMIMPLGLNRTAYGDSSTKAFEQLVSRSIRSVLQFEQSPLHDKRNCYIVYTVAKMVISGVFDGSTTKKYTFGIMQDMTASLAALITSQPQRRIAVILGGKDRIFPASELAATLSRPEFAPIKQIYFAKASHSSMAIRSSKALLQAAITSVRE
jgi:pimeloyl-ACP methyl ester carboxylesterase